MSFITKIMGFAARCYTKNTGKALVRFSNIGENPAKVFVKTGTKVALDPDIGKIIRPGKGNFLRSQLGIKEIISYPKGSILGGDDGLIAMSFNRGFRYECTPKAFGEYVRNMKELAELAASKIVG